MTLEAMADDSDVAQARIFLDQLDAEIDILSQRIETAEALSARARKARKRGQADRFGAEATALRGELYEVHRLADAIVFRFPAVMTRGESAQSADDPA